MGKSYFETESDGTIFVLVNAQEESIPRIVEVELPNGTHVCVQIQKDYFAHIVQGVHGKHGKVLKAKQILGPDERSRMFANNWDEIIPLIIAAAETNNLFTVTLTQEEYKRLSTGNNLDRLKKRLLPRLSDMLYLNSAEDTWQGDDLPALELVRICGGCPH